jgi:cyclic-di-AMP phosphodiesterase PgpH
MKMPENSKAPSKTMNKAEALRKSADRILPPWAHRLYEPKIQRWLLIVGTSLLAALMMAPISFRDYSLTIGEPAQETIISPATYRVDDELATNKSRDEILQSVRPVYDFDEEMVHDVQARITAAFDFMRAYLETEASARAKEEGKSLEKDNAAHQSATTKAESFRPLDDNTLRTRFENLLGATVTTSSFLALKSMGFSSTVETDLRSLVAPVLLKGVVLSKDLVIRDGSGGILLRSKHKDKMELLKDPSSLFDLKEAETYVNSGDNFQNTDPFSDPVISRAISKVASNLINVNITYNRAMTASVKQEALASAKPVYFQVLKGEPIIKKGEPANEGHLRKLAGLHNASPPYSRYMILAGFALMLLMLLRLSFYFYEQHMDRRRHATNDLLLVCILLLGTIIMVRFISSHFALMPSAGQGMDSKSFLFAAPVATGSMLTALLVDARIGFVFAALAAICASLSLEGDVYMLAFYFVSGIVGLHGMTRIVDRTSVLRAGLVVGLANMLSILAVKMALGKLTNFNDFYETGLGFLGGVLSGLLVSGLAPLLEPLGYTTNVKLLELANLNHPLLKGMALEAPGTYHHSIMVGNLAEAAAEVIDANPMLARVGAYYHDVGKVGGKNKPFYFIENQPRNANPHDKLEPSMSALILVSHVKNGVERAKEHGLGAPILDIIQQHHGTSLIKFFYNKALERAEKNHHAVQEQKYHYPGPRPQSKEAALVMLADVVEAACRTLSDPTPARIQKRVQELVLGLFNEGELNESTLTLKDLHAITKSFVRALQGIYHARIAYPAAAVQERPRGDLHRLETDKDRPRSGRPPEENGTNIRRLGL